MMRALHSFVLPVLAANAAANFLPTISLNSVFPIPTIGSNSSSPATISTSEIVPPTPTFFSPTTSPNSPGPTSLNESLSPSATGVASPATPTDVETIYQRRLSVIVGGLNLSQVAEISTWFSTLDASGTWSDVNYTTGCAAQRANWPAGDHWTRLQMMAAAYHGGVQGADQYVKNQAIRDAVSLGMDYWFSRDFTNPACLFRGGSASCPCSNLDHTLWNGNWFSNVILVPNLVGTTCLLLKDTLSPSEFNNCTRITSRSYDSFLDSSLGSFLTGANALDVAKIGIDGGLLASNVTRIEDGFNQVHSTVIVQDAVGADGIRRDGSFGQHRGLLYNGNYGKDYANDALNFEVEASGTRFGAGSESRAAVETLFDGNRWMIYFNSLTGVNHWDFSVLGRFIAFAVADGMATASLNTNLTEVGYLGQLWSSEVLIEFAKQLSTNSTNANAGNLQGNRMFPTNDYMVHRGKNYVSTLKMYSSRTESSECTNTQNPFGFHLSDGALRTYLVGNEYEDIAAAWDWNLVPGITVDYGATKLDCSHTLASGIEAFVGGVSDGDIGLAVMRYTNPLTKSLSWQKAWFFLPDDVQHVVISNLSSTTNASVLTVLDQRLYDGHVVLDDVKATLTPSVKSVGFDTLWHGGVGYVADGNVTFAAQAGSKSGSWQAIGTSTQPPATVDLFAAWLEHRELDQPVAYTAYPGTSSVQFLEKAMGNRPKTLRNDEVLSAVYDTSNRIVMIVFWHNAGGSITFTPDIGDSAITVGADANVAVIYRLQTGDVTVADPSQTLTSVQLTFSSRSDYCDDDAPLTYGDEQKRTMTFILPTGGIAGSSVTRKLQ